MRLIKSLGDYKLHWLTPVAVIGWPIIILAILFLLGWGLAILIDHL